MAHLAFENIQSGKYHLSCNVVLYHWLISCRDILAKLSNDEALHYGRKVRLIVHRLRIEIIDVNEEMKALNRLILSHVNAEFNNTD